MQIIGMAYGLLTASLVTEVGGQIGWLATGMSFEFKRPVYAGDQITCHWLIVDIDERGRAKAEVRILNAEGITVLEATTSGVLPGAEGRECLKQILAHQWRHPRSQLISRYVNGGFQASSVI